MTISITSLTHHAEAADEALNRLRHAGILPRRITVQVPGWDEQQIQAQRAVMVDGPHIRLEWLAFLALVAAVALFHGIHAHWVGPAVVGLTAAMLGCLAWTGLEQAAGERRRQRCAEMVEENGVLITVHDVSGAEAGRIERLLHDSGGETISQSAPR